MRLKVFTAALLFFAIGMIAVAPWILGPRPEQGPELKAYVYRFAFFVVATAVALIGAVIGAVVVARRAREEFRQQVHENVRELVEGTLAAHKRKSRQEDP